MNHLTPDELDELRAALEAEHAEHGRKVNGDWQGTPAGFGAGEADPVDAADAMEELTVNVPLVEELEKRYKEIGAALKRMDEGTYGMDENTGEPIDVERLRANPAATRNI